MIMANKDSLKPTPKEFFVLIVEIIILVALIPLTIYGGFKMSQEKQPSYGVSECFNLVCIDKKGVNEIYYDKNTGVMYYFYHSTNGGVGITPVYNSDGSIKIYDRAEQSDNA